ncbi:hypothetical protein [Haloferula sargassicola]|uniref:PepSY domain-containing protein n=1 Tax=Haloferula sargassicola TaxID=490096 RepID=A0ABP9UJR4_9BACT
MNTMNLTKTMIALTLTTGFAAADDDGRELSLADCPAAVRTTIEAQARDGRIEEVEHHAIGDQALYIAEVDLPKDLDLKIHVRENGTLVKTVEDVPHDKAPRFLGQLATERNGRLEDIEKETAGEKVIWHVEIDRAGQPDLNLIVDASGNLVRETEDHDD